jgi:seryl-tRNA synthetase
MLDIQFIRDNPEVTQEKARQKGYDIDIPALLKLDAQRRELLTSVETLRARRNDNANKMKGGQPDPQLVEQGKQIKTELTAQEEQLAGVEEQYETLLKSVPNMPLDDVPIGASEDDNVVAKTVGEPPKFDFTPKQHWELAEARDLIDKERAAKVAGSRFADDMLPVRYIGYSTSFRREAGTYGKDMEGILRLHQFDKLEMEVFSTAETGRDEHMLAIAIQEYLVQQLGIPYHVLNKCTFDIGKPNARGVDIECWLPGQGKYRETHTADYMTDYQARDLKIRVRHKDGRISLVHTNDATAFALGRTMIAIMENYQTADGRITVPEVLRPYMGGLQQF